MSKPKNIIGTETEKNIVKAYISESTAYTRYMYYAKAADKELYYPVGQIFRETAENELEHSKVYFKMLQGGRLTVPAEVDAGVIATTAENLKTAMAEERTEGVDFYLKAAQTADKEGFAEIAEHFRAIAEIELHHMEQFGWYLQQLQDGTLWKRDKPIKWRCLECGYIHEGTEPPKECPACDHPYQYYMAQDYNP